MFAVLNGDAKQSRYLLDRQQTGFTEAIVPAFEAIAMCETVHDANVEMFACS